MARTHVSFDADEDSFPRDGEPAGRELADYVHAALHGAGFAPGEPEDREGRAWDVAAWCEAVHAALVAHAGIRDVRWFEPDEVHDWADTPG